MGALEGPTPSPKIRGQAKNFPTRRLAMAPGGREMCESLVTEEQTRWSNKPANANYAGVIPNGFRGNMDGGIRENPEVQTSVV